MDAKKEGLSNKTVIIRSWQLIPADCCIGSPHVPLAQ